MATKTKAKPRGKDDVSYPVSYGNVGIGDRTARIGLSIDRGNITVTKADNTFTDKRVTCRLTARPNGDAPGQTTLPGLDGLLEFEGVADVKGIRAGGRDVSIGLTFVIQSIDLQTLTHFAKREGELIVSDVADIPEEDKAGENGESEAD